MNKYLEFIKSKEHLSGNFGFEPVFMPDYLFDFQKYGIEWLIRKGRAALFFDTGLGKTIMELVTAKNLVMKTNKPVLILTPLAVAFQFIAEAEKIGIDDVSYSRQGELKTKIVIANYERLHYFNPNDFSAVLCDESSILKNFDGAIKNQITSFFKKMKYRYLFTATPSPNDFTELGTSSEALGHMGYMDMLSRFFKNNEDTISPMNIGTEWVLKGHAEDSFFRWVSSWSLSARKPSDLGNFDDTRYRLPELVINHHHVINRENMVVDGQILMFNTVKKRQSEIRAEQRQTYKDRCEKAVELAKLHETSVYWCNLNPEGDLIEKLDNDAYQLKGTMKLEQKEEILLAFSKGEIKKLISKPKITSFGLNWQHCNHTVFFPSFSYEQYYQAIRRFWRFGQKRDVIADLVLSDGQKRILDALLAKGDKADRLFSKLNASTHQPLSIVNKDHITNISLPNFLN